MSVVGHGTMPVSKADQFWQYAKEALLAAEDGSAGRARKVEARYRASMLTFAADFWYALVHCVGELRRIHIDDRLGYAPRRAPIDRREARINENALLWRAY